MMTLWTRPHKRSWDLGRVALSYIQMMRRTKL